MAMMAERSANKMEMNHPQQYQPFSLQTLKTSEQAFRAETLKIRRKFDNSNL